MPKPPPAYVGIAGDIARQIRSGQLPPSTQLPSAPEMAQQHGVSEIVIRQVVGLLVSQGLVRSRPRRGIFVADRPGRVRVSPERQMEDPEVTFGNETDREVRVDHETEQVRATEELAEVFGVSTDDDITHTITRATEGGRPISISDTYQPVGITGISSATILEETVSDRLPNPLHAEWLGIDQSDLIKAVHQRFLTPNDQVIMISDVSYPRDRYESFLFRMAL